VLPDISMFTKLKTLVIDRNHITDAMVIPALPGLQNLWANDNGVRTVPYLRPDGLTDWLAGRTAEPHWSALT